MLRRYLLNGIGALALVGILGAPGQAHAQGMRGGGSMRAMPMTRGGMMPGMQGGMMPAFQGAMMPGSQGRMMPGFQGGTTPGFQGGFDRRFGPESRPGLSRPF